MEGEWMSSSGLTPGQAALRFALEVAALVAWGTAAFSVARSTTSSELVGWLAAGAAVVVAGAAWATFRVPGDASASGGAPVPVSGTVRLVLESVLLLGAAGAVAATASILFGAVLVVTVLGHYIATLDRVRWLLSR